jgi:hypothetical protein
MPSDSVLMYTYAGHLRHSLRHRAALRSTTCTGHHGHDCIQHPPHIHDRLAMCTFPAPLRLRAQRQAALRCTTYTVPLAKMTFSFRLPWENQSARKLRRQVLQLAARQSTSAPGTLDTMFSIEKPCDEPRALLTTFTMRFNNKRPGDQPVLRAPSTRCDSASSHPAKPMFTGHLRHPAWSTGAPDTLDTMSGIEQPGMSHVLRSPSP